MSTTKKRIDALKVLVSGSVISTTHECNLVKGELSEVHRVEVVTDKRRRHLLQILHSTRGLDTALGSMARYHGLSFRTPSLGGYLYAFAHHSKPGLGHIPESEHVHFQTNIVKQRNKYMHEAGAFPHREEEVKKMLAEMQACMARIVAL